MTCHLGYLAWPRLYPAIPDLDAIFELTSTAVHSPAGMTYCLSLSLFPYSTLFQDLKSSCGRVVPSYDYFYLFSERDCITQYLLMRSDRQQPVIHICTVCNLAAPCLFQRESRVIIIIILWPRLAGVPPAGGRNTEHHARD